MKVKLISILLTAVFAYANVRGQDFQFAKRVFGDDRISAFSLGNNYVLVNSFYDSCQFDTMPVTYSRKELYNVNSQITVITKQGAVLSHFTLSGVNAFPNGFGTGQQILNDTEWVMITNVISPIYSNGLLQVGPALSENSSGFIIRFVAVSVTGKVRLLKEFPVDANGILSSTSLFNGFRNNNAMSYCLDTVNQQLYVLFNCVFRIDSLLINPNYFEKEKAILFKVDLATKSIANDWKLPVEFDRIVFVGGKLILAGRSRQLNYQFTVQNQTYMRDSVNDELTSDLVWGAFNPTSGVFDWHQHYKLKMNSTTSNGYFLLANTNNRAAIVCRYNDTITVNGTQYGEVIPFLTKDNFAMIGTDANGGQQWVNTFSGILNLTQFYSKANSFCLNYYEFDNVAYMNGLVLPKATNGENFVQIQGVTGALRRSLNYVFKLNWEGKIDGIDITEDSIQFAIVSLFGLPNDTLVLLDKPYYLKDPLALWSEYVLVAFKATSQSFPTQMHERAFIEHRPVKAYPNPVTNQLYLHGFADEQESIITVVNVQGRVVLERTQPFGQAINTSTWEKGLYLVMVQTGPNRQVCRVMKE